ncbi:MAG: hypothetical protein AB8F95_01530 [Bacteroidia bacterium]
MKTTKSITLKSLLGLLVLTALLGACKQPCDDPTDMECPNFDPCFGEVWVEPEIVIKEMLSSKGDTFYHTITDTTVSTSDLTSFSTNVEYESYSWTIGSDPRSFDKKEVRLHFLGFTGNVPVTFIGKRKAQPCFPDKPLIDTLHKIMTVVPYNASSIVGRYFGHVEGSPEDTFTVSVWVDTTSLENSEIPRIAAPSICGNYEWYDGQKSLGYASISVDAINRVIGGCIPFEAVARLDPSDKNALTMQYRFTPSGDPDDAPGPASTFVGRRIQ